MSLDNFNSKPSEPTSYPACFPSQADYNRWRKLARLSQEVVSPCSDCDAKYRDRMQAQNKCHRETVREIHLINRAAQN